MIGRTLSHYRINAAIGKGGMGDVYRATDSKLGREVALKVLPPDVACDHERLARFQREARALAALNNPHIVTIHSVEEADGVHFLTMELVEGRALHRLIPASGLPVERIIKIATALAEALAAAHEEGVVHRDLKPANVMVTDDGRVKVLDFGLAKDVRGDNPGDATLTSASPTQAGLVMGTPAYMSPEQISGRALDHRTDIFSLGIVLHEMATGRRPFEGSAGVRINELNRDAQPGPDLAQVAFHHIPRSEFPANGANIEVGAREVQRGAVEHAAAETVLERAVQQAPGYADAWAMLSLLYREEYTHGFNVKPDAIGRAHAAARKAVEAAPSNHLAYHALAAAQFFRRELQAFRNSAERAIALNPMDGFTSAYLGFLIAYAGDWERGCALVEHARGLNPHHPGWYWFPYFFDAYRKHDYRGALDFALKVNMPGFWRTNLALATAYGQLGKKEEACNAVRELLALRPDFPTVAREELGKWWDQLLVEHLLEGLRKAGLEIASSERNAVPAPAAATDRKTL